MYPSAVVSTRCLPRRWEARAANEALHNRRKMVAETNRAKHLVKLCEAGMHADALREQLHDSAQDFTDFNHVRDAASFKWRRRRRHERRTRRSRTR